MPIAIKVEQVYKQYRLGLVGSGTMRDDIESWWYRVRGKEDPTLKLGEINDRSTAGDSNYVWALRDINFEVQQGEVLGIIGKNGAGKSTLLKLLSRVTSPTTGNIKAKGRIASLLEVGTGFHPELTGRENVFLNGAIMGMKKHEIARKLDEIVDFSGVERYLETPVKRYSSGMYVRLAFAVAAHLEPEILIVDEVLAVGDAEFQKKCLGKMGDISKSEGRTILFVSHNMPAVSTLCSRSLLLKSGGLIMNGDTPSVIANYLGNGATGNGTVHLVDFQSDFLFSDFKLHSCHVHAEGVKGSEILENKAVEVVTELTLFEIPTAGLLVTYHLCNDMGEAIFSMIPPPSMLGVGHNKLTCTIPPSFLQSGKYFLTLFIVDNQRAIRVLSRDCLSFIIVESPREIGSFMGREPGFIRPILSWDVQIS